MKINIEYYSFIDKDNSLNSKPTYYDHRIEKINKRSKN